MRHNQFVAKCKQKEMFCLKINVLNFLNHNHIRLCATGRSKEMLNKRQSSIKMKKKKHFTLFFFFHFFSIVNLSARKSRRSILFVCVLSLSFLIIKVFSSFHFYHFHGAHTLFLSTLIAACASKPTNYVHRTMV